MPGVSARFNLRLTAKGRWLTLILSLHLPFTLDRASAHEQALECPWTAPSQCDLLAHDGRIEGREHAPLASGLFALSSYVCRESEFTRQYLLVVWHNQQFALHGYCGADIYYP